MVRADIDEACSDGHLRFVYQLSDKTQEKNTETAKYQLAEISALASVADVTNDCAETASGPITPRLRSLGRAPPRRCSRRHPRPRKNSTHNAVV